MDRLRAIIVRSRPGITVRLVDNELKPAHRSAVGSIQRGIECLLKLDIRHAVRIRGRYIIPAAAIEQLAERAAVSGGCLDVAALATERRTAREIRQLSEDKP